MEDCNLLRRSKNPVFKLFAACCFVTNSKFVTIESDASSVMMLLNLISSIPIDTLASAPPSKMIYSVKPSALESMTLLMIKEKKVNS